MHNSYAGKVHLQVLIFIAMLASIVSTLTPPFQSPDEPAHIVRAYLLTRGQILLEPHPEQGAGGAIDAGLLAYYGAFLHLPFHPEQKISKKTQDTASSVRWTGQRVFTAAPGTGYYFPLAYAPQAIGLGLGEQLGLSVRHSYYITRLIVLAASTSVLALAFTIFPTNALILGLFITPMSIFQFASASLDAFTFALTVLCVALFMRGCIKDFEFPKWMAYSLAISVFLLTTSRINLMPLLLFPFAVWFIRRGPGLFWQFVLVSALSVVWVILAVKSTYVNLSAESSTSDIIRFYFNNPDLMSIALYNTISDQNYRDFYVDSFIGILGWLDTRLKGDAYRIIYWCLSALVLLSISVKTLRIDWIPRLIIGVVALTSVFLTFFALLITWNPVPTDQIAGVQGRYFVSTLIILAYALSGCAGGFTAPWKKLAIIPLLAIAIAVIFYVPHALLDRYYVSPRDMADENHTLLLSAPLDVGSEITIQMTARHQDEQTGLLRLGVMFATDAEQTPGDAELRLKRHDGSAFVQRFSLTDVADNRYHFFDLDGKHYSSGEIAAITGGGVSVWESHDEHDNVNTCIVYEYSTGIRRFTPGCRVS